MISEQRTAVKKNLKVYRLYHTKSLLLGVVSISI